MKEYYTIKSEKIIEPRKILDHKHKLFRELDPNHKRLFALSLEKFRIIDNVIEIRLTGSIKAITFMYENMVKPIGKMLAEESKLELTYKSDKKDETKKIRNFYFDIGYDKLVEKLDKELKVAEEELEEKKSIKKVGTKKETTGKGKELPKIPDKKSSESKSNKTTSNKSTVKSKTSAKKSSTKNKSASK